MVSDLKDVKTFIDTTTRIRWELAGDMLPTHRGETPFAILVSKEKIGDYEEGKEEEIEKAINNYLDKYVNEKFGYSDDGYYRLDADEFDKDRYRVVCVFYDEWLRKHLDQLSDTTFLFKANS